MNVVLGSMFRDSESYLERYFDQVVGLRDLLEKRGDTLRVVAVECDSSDNTWERLDRFGFAKFCDLTLIKLSDGCPYFPSVDSPIRWRHHAWLQNAVISEVDENDDIFIYVESDLDWLPSHLFQLIMHAKRNHNCWSCPNWAQEPGKRYYDTWGSRRNGERFDSHPDLGTKPIQMDSVASVIAMPAKIARSCRFHPQDAFVGLCREIREFGWEIWMDPTLWVIHP